MRYNEVMGWLVPIGIWVVIAASFLWAGREAQRLRDTARDRGYGAPDRRRSFGQWAGLESVDVDHADAELTKTKRPGQPRPASWDLATLPQMTRGADHPSLSTRPRYAWEDGTTSDRGQFN